MASGKGVSPRKTTAVKARVRIAAYWAVGLGLAAAYVPLRGSSWRSAVDLHTQMEGAASILALLVGVLALVRFYSQRNNTFLFIGTGFLGAAFLDGFHAAAASHYLTVYSLSGSAAPILWTWAASRVFLSAMLALSWYAWTREDRLGAAGRMSERTIYVIAGALALASFLFFAFVPLPRAASPEFRFHRPGEFVPALFFLIALIGYLRKGAWRSTAFEHWLVLSLIIGFVGQSVFMSQSGKFFEFEFGAAHVLKQTGYICVLTGLLISMSAIFKKAESNARALESEIAVRQRVEHVLAASEQQFTHASD